VLTALRGEVELAYVADVSAAAAARVGKSYRCRSVHIAADPDELPATDAVLVAVPVGVRRPYYELLADRGTAVLAEKPAVVDMESLKFLCGAFAPDRFAVGFQRRTYASTAMLRRLVESGVLGPLLNLRSEEGDRMTRTGVQQRFHDDISLSGGGILMDLGCHAVDLFFFLTGAGASDSIDASAVMDGCVDREVLLRARLPIAPVPVSAEVSLSWLAHRAGMLHLAFENGVAHVSTAPGGLVHLSDRNGAPVAGVAADVSTAPAAATTVHQACYLVWRSFLDALAGRADPMLTLDSIAPTVQLIESAYRHIRSQT
jgi:predicted dehydrogenase